MSPDFPLIIADESVDGRIILALISAGYTVFPIATKLSGIPDSRVIEIAVDKDAFIITEDKDFGDELIYRKVTRVGSLLLRLGEVQIEERIRIIIETLHTNGIAMQGAFSVLTAKKLRIRQYDME